LHNDSFHIIIDMHRPAKGLVCPY